jgi:hypothetical protein
VTQLKRQIESMTGIQSGKYKLYLMSDQGWLGREELRLNGIMLYTLGIEDGDELSVEVSDVLFINLHNIILFICR